MRIVIQRVIEASVKVDNEIIGSISKGLMVLVGIDKEDELKDAEWLAIKTANLRIFPDENGVMNRSVIEVGGEILSISQFTLLASAEKGNRPSYIRAASHSLAIKLYEHYNKKLTEITESTVKTGKFGTDMKVSLINDGPVTIIIDSRKGG